MLLDLLDAFGYFNKYVCITVTFNILVLNLIWLSVLYVPRAPSFIWTEIFSYIYIVDWLHYLKNFIVFWYSIIILLYYYINDSLSITGWLFSGYIYIFFFRSISIKFGVRSLVFSDLHSETKGSWFEFGC